MRGAGPAAVAVAVHRSVGRGVRRHPDRAAPGRRGGTATGTGRRGSPRRAARRAQRSYATTTGAWSLNRASYVAARSISTDRTRSASPGVASW